VNEVVISHVDRTTFEHYVNHRFDKCRKKRSYPGEDEYFLQWLLFYTDIEHSVSPVTDGVRIVLQFDVYDRSPSESTEIVGAGKDSHEDDDEKENPASDYDHIMESTKPIDQNGMTGSKERVLSQILSIPQNESTSKHAPVIPLYYLYTSQTILPEKLKNIDKVLFDTLLAAEFRLALVSVELVLETDYEENENQ
jgi:hypothetical protein